MSARSLVRIDDLERPRLPLALRVLLAAFEREAGLTPIGRWIARMLVVQLLVTRLRVEALVREHPEILAQEVQAPIVILGLPRTGTTHLHNLLSQDPGLRSLPYWEALEPIPAGRDPRHLPEPDPRVRRCAQGLRFLHWVMPLFPLMHEMEPEARHHAGYREPAAIATLCGHPPTTRTAPDRHAGRMHRCGAL